MMKKITFTVSKVIFICLWCILLSGCGNSFTPNGKGIEVRGSTIFKNQVNDSLKLLKDKAPDAYDIVLNYVGRIEQGKHSGMWAYKNPPTFELNDHSAFYSIT